jgi:excisionase family DNA binding protein
MDELMTLKEMAEKLKFCDKTFSKYVKEYQIPFVKLGRSKRFDPKQVKKFLAEKQIAESVPEAPLKKAVKSNVRILPHSESKRIERDWGLS